MHFIFEITKFDEPIQLGPHSIDNKNGNLKIYLNSVIFWHGYYNINNEDYITYITYNKGEEATQTINFEGGFYNIGNIVDIIEKAQPFLP